jgi:hypothetical protein
MYILSYAAAAILILVGIIRLFPEDGGSTGRSYSSDDDPLGIKPFLGHKKKEK